MRSGSISTRLARRLGLTGRGLALAAAATATLLVLAGLGFSTLHGPHPSPGVSGSHRAPSLRYLDPAFSHITTTRNLTYGQAPGRGGQPQALTLDLDQPAGDTVARRPAIVWVHGGSFCCGDKSDGPSAELAEDFAYLGYVTVSIDYRLLAPSACVVERETLTPSCENDATAAEHDAQAAVRWLRAHASRYRIDPTRIGIGGDSAGAITATLVGLNTRSTGNSGNLSYSSHVRAFMSLSGALPAGRLGATAVSSGAAAGLLFSGTADHTVPHQWSTQTTSALLDQRVPAILVSADAGHDPYYPPFKTQIDDESDYFFYTFMDVAHAPGSPADAPTVFGRQQRSLARDDPAYARAIAVLRARRPEPGHGPKSDTP